jgi:protein-tyrosine sulfotransferase
VKKIELHMISGLRKSGTTLMKSLLDGHPELFVIPPAEFDFFCYSSHDTLVQPKYDHIQNANLLLRRLANQDFITRMNDDTRDVESVQLADDRQTDLRSGFDVTQFLRDADIMNVESYPEIFTELFTAMARNCGIAHTRHDSLKFIFKNTMETEFFGLYKKWFPNMKLLYVLRNPYAQLAAHSRGEYIEGKSFEYPLLAPKINAMKYEYYFINYWKEVYPEDVKIVRFEDVVESTVSTMQEIAGFLGIKFNESMSTPTILGRAWGGNSSAKGEVYSGIDPKPLHRWKKVLGPQEIYIVNKYFSKTIRQYGYDQHSGNRSVFPIHRSETLRRYVGNKYLEFTPYY